MRWLRGKKKDRTDDAAAAVEDSRGTVNAGTDTSDGVDSGVNDADGKQGDAGNKRPEYGALRTDGAASDGPGDSGQHDGTTPDDESANGSGGVGAGVETADGTDGSGQQTQVVIIERKGTGLNLLLGSALALALAISFAVYTTNPGGDSTMDDMQAMRDGLGKISTGVSEAVGKRQAAVDRLLYSSPAPSKKQLDKLGGWKLELKQTAAGGKQHVVVTNVDAPSAGNEKGASGTIVWEGDVEASSAVKYSLSTPMETTFDGTPTDNLLTRSYSLTGTLDVAGKRQSDNSKKTGATGYGGAAAENPSVVALIDGDTDGRVEDLKTVSVGSNESENDGTKPDSKGGKSSMRSQQNDDDGLSDGFMRPRYSASA